MDIDYTWRKIGCFRASSAVILLLGTGSSILSNSSQMHKSIFVSRIKGFNPNTNSFKSNPSVSCGNLILLLHSAAASFSLELPTISAIWQSDVRSSLALKKG